MAFKKVTAVFMGMSSGLLYGLLTSTLTAYFIDIQIQLATIGFLTLRMLPYSFKYLWSPLIDSAKIKIFPSNFGQRKSWMVFTQILLISLIICLSFTSTKEDFFSFCIFAFLLAFFAATYDIAMEAYRIELFGDERKSTGNFLVILGFRIGLVFSSILALYLASVIEWKWIFISIATLIVPCMVVILFSEDSKDIDINSNRSKLSLWIKENFFGAFSSLFILPRFGLIFLLVGFYKMSDGYLDAMLIPFLTDIGFSKKEIAKFSNTISIIASVLGSFVGAYFISKFNMVKVLIGGEFFSAISNLLFIPLFYVGKNDMLLALVTFFESFCSGICNITLITYMSMLCSKRFTATHYSILISISSLTRVLLSSTSGAVALELGWVKFCIVSSLFSIPSLICISLLYRLQKAKLSSVIADN